jgi:pilus assembly protein CpaB
MDRRKIILLFGGAWISAALLTWFLYAKTTGPRQERRVAVVVAAREMQLGTLLRPSDLKVVDYPESAVPRGVVSDPKSAVSHVLLYPVAANEPVVGSKLSGTTTAEGVSSTIEPGYRAVSVQVTDFSGVAGLIQPNSRVDVLFTHPGTMAEASTSTILQNVKVLSTGRMASAGQPVDTKAPPSKVVTLLLTPDEAQKLELAKNQGRIGFSLRNPLDPSQTASTAPVTAEALDPNIMTRVARRPRPAARGSVQDPATWDELTKPKPPEKKEPEKPRLVIDVYRGDKHVQESFK